MHLIDATRTQQFEHGPQIQGLPAARHALNLGPGQGFGFTRGEHQGLPFQTQQRQIARMASMLEADTGETQLQSYDWRYYDTKLRREEYGVDQTEVSHFFPLQQVLDGIQAASDAGLKVKMPFIQEAREAGGRLAVIDPRRTESTESADLWLRPRPGSDGALALALASEIIREGGIDEAFIHEHVTGFDEFAASVRECSIEWASAITESPSVRQTERLRGSTMKMAFDRCG